MNKDDRFFLIIFIVIEALLVIFTFLIICKLLLNPDGFGNLNLQVLGIVLPIVATIVGIMVPLHYSLILNILEELSLIDSNQNADEENINMLNNYIAASDIIIYVTAWFGASSLMEGANAIATYFDIFNQNFFSIISVVVGCFYLFLSLVSIGRSLCVTKDLKRHWGFFSSILFILIISFIWTIILVVFPNRPDVIIVIALLILSDFYIGWHLLKIPFIPINRKLRIIKSLKGKTNEKSEGKKND